MRLASIAILFFSTVLGAANPPVWTEPIAPFRIIGNVHYVGSAELASFLITTPEGHILIDAPMEENVPRILQSIRTLGFKPEDIRILLNTHAHFDHAGGLAEIKRLTGARLMLSAADAELAARGGLNDFAFGDSGPYPKVVADRILRDGEKITLGGQTLTAIATPGHTKGGTSWSFDVVDGGKTFRVLIANSMTAPGYDLASNEAYPTIMDDYRASFERLKNEKTDVFLAPHGSFFQLRRRRAAAVSGDMEAFVDREALPAYLSLMQEQVEEQHRNQADEQEIRRVLDALHDAASKAQLERYFALFAPDAVYIGTDATERWSLEEFRGFVTPYFTQGRGWTYEPTSRHVTLGPENRTAWFDEILENENYGTTRGTGVLVKIEDEWKIAQYHLTIPVPNDLAKRVVGMIRGDE